MREIKFRIIYTAQNGEKSIHYSDDRCLIGLDGKIYENYGESWKNPVWEESFDVAKPTILQQYTGYKDKNGKEIYEGDRLKYNNHLYKELVAEVIFGEYSDGECYSDNLHTGWYCQYEFFYDELNWKGTNTLADIATKSEII